MDDVKEKVNEVSKPTTELNIPFYKDKTKEPEVEETTVASTLVEQIHEQAKYDIVTHDEDVQKSILESAKKNISTEIDTISNKVKKDNNKASMEKNDVACGIFGYSSKKEVVDRWQQKMMVFGYNFWFCIYYVIAFFTVAPITLVFGKISEAIKKTWIALTLSIFIYCLFTVVLPLVIGYYNNQ